MDIGIVILAAGSSTRLGRPKQLISTKGVTLLEHTISCCQILARSIHVVSGAMREKVEEIALQNGANVIFNPDFKLGIGYSIAAGINNVGDHVDGIIIVLVDQPFLTEEVMQNIVRKAIENPDTIITCTYREGSGPPAFFPRKYFCELSKLNGDEGAKTIIKKHLIEVLHIPCYKGDIDVDVVDDLQALKEHRYTS